MSDAPGYALGQRLALGVVGPLTRTQIVRFCGTSGDFAAFHTDEPAAQAAGYPSVFAPGMLTLGIASRLLAAAVGPPNLRRFGGRFVAVVWPDDTLTVSAEVIAVTAEAISFSITVTTQDDRTVLSGYAEAAPTGLSAEA